MDIRVIVLCTFLCVLAAAKPRDESHNLPQQMTGKPVVAKRELVTVAPKPTQRGGKKHKRDTVVNIPPQLTGKERKDREIQKREITDPKQFFNNAFCNKYYEHSACAISANPSKEGVTAEQKNLILKEHNEYRSSQLIKDGQPAPANMQKMYWDDFIAYVAQKHASTCVYEHDKNENRNIPGYMSVGQNIAYGQEDWTKANFAWYSEEKDFVYGSGSTGGDVGHYTQIVWATTNRVGCGFAQCSFGPYYVCNYGPAGNMQGMLNTPYKTAASAGADCPNFNKDGLCDCGGIRCEHGKVNLATCGCTCPNSYFVGKTCKLDCNKAKDKFWCSQYQKSDCNYYSNFPADCAKMCGGCGENKPVLSGLAGSVKGSGPLPKPKNTAADKNKPCTKVDEPTCNQPDAGSYWAKSYCASGCPVVHAKCPAMCGTCKATACKDMRGNTKQIGDSWLGNMGQYTCKTDGITWTKGCVSKGKFYAVGSVSYKTEKETFWGETFTTKYKISCIQNGNRINLRFEQVN